MIDGYQIIFSNIIFGIIIFTPVTYIDLLIELLIMFDGHQIIFYNIIFRIIFSLHHSISFAYFCHHRNTQSIFDNTF